MKIIILTLFLIASPFLLVATLYLLSKRKEVLRFAIIHIAVMLTLHSTLCLSEN